MLGDVQGVRMRAGPPLAAAFAGPVGEGEADRVVDHEDVGVAREFTRYLDGLLLR